MSKDFKLSIEQLQSNELAWQRVSYRKIVHMFMIFSHREKGILRNLSKILHTQIFRLKILHRKSAYIATFFLQINSVNASNINNFGIFGFK